MTKEVKIQLEYIERLIERNNIKLSLTDTDLIVAVVECCYLQGKADVYKELNQKNKI